MLSVLILYNNLLVVYTSIIDNNNSYRLILLVDSSFTINHNKLLHRTQWAKSPKTHSFKLFFWRFCPLGSKSDTLA